MFPPPDPLRPNAPYVGLQRTLLARASHVAEVAEMVADHVFNVSCADRRESLVAKLIAARPDLLSQSLVGAPRGDCYVAKRKKRPLTPRLLADREKQDAAKERVKKILAEAARIKRRLEKDAPPPPPTVEQPTRQPVLRRYAVRVPNSAAARAELRRLEALCAE